MEEQKSGIYEVDTSEMEFVKISAFTRKFLKQRYGQGQIPDKNMIDRWGTILWNATYTQRGRQKLRKLDDKSYIIFMKLYDELEKNHAMLVFPKDYRW